MARAISASGDQTLRVWDLKSGQTLHMLKGHTDCCRVAITLDGRRAVSASNDCRLRVWDLTSGEEISTFSGESQCSVALSLQTGEQSLPETNQAKCISSGSSRDEAKTVSLFFRLSVLSL